MRKFHGLKANISLPTTCHTVRARMHWTSRTIFLQIHANIQIFGKQAATADMKETALLQNRTSQDVLFFRGLHSRQYFARCKTWSPNPVCTKASGSQAICLSYLKIGTNFKSTRPPQPSELAPLFIDNHKVAHACLARGETHWQFCNEVKPNSSRSRNRSLLLFISLGRIQSSTLHFSSI